MPLIANDLYRGEAGLIQHTLRIKCLKISISTNEVSIKRNHLGINAIFFATEARIYLKGVLITFHFVPFWGWGVRLDFL